MAKPSNLRLLVLREKKYKGGKEKRERSYRTTHHKYKINFQFGTKYTPMSVIRVPGFDTDYLVGIEREINRTGSSTKLNVISIEVDGLRMECTLFGNYVDELNAFLSSGELQNVVISLQFAKTRMMENTDSPTQGLSQLCDSGKQNVDDEFIHLIPRNIIQGLKDCKEENTFVVLATIKHIVVDDEWWYTTCLCNKIVYSDSKMFFCEKCNKHVMKVQPRYKLKVRVMDETDSTTFVLFDRDATTLINNYLKVMTRFSHGGSESVEPHTQRKRLCSIKDVEQNNFSIEVPQDLFKKNFNEIVDLHSETVDLASDSQLSVEVVHPGLTLAHSR
ncbi:uncharacterized protein [Phaseolus vulgaris]|uniref:uncharacterized protein n=1 Tax=Phaseolus vulgaris TaxID=3885 RepID=UPI0035C9F49C